MLFRNWLNIREFMNISPTSEIGQEIIARSHTLFKDMGGAVVNFQRLCYLFNVKDVSKGAEIAALLCRRDVHVLKHVYFFIDESDSPLLLRDSIVHNYVRTGELFNPVTNELVPFDEAEERIVIEFEVIE